MQEFQGWTPEIVENLTFDQLDEIVGELNIRRKYVSPADVTLEKIKSVLFKKFGFKERKQQKDGVDNFSIELKDMPTGKATKEQLEAWYKTGMKDSLPEFIKQHKKGNKK